MGALGRGLIVTVLVAAILAACGEGEPTEDELERGAELYQARV